MDALLNWIPEYGYPALFLLLMLGIVGLPIPDETLLTFSGYLIFKNQLLWMPTMATAFFGSICGITISYLIGRRLGLFVVRTVGHRLRIGLDDLDKVHAWYMRWGKYTLILSYFVPGVRHLAALVAGSSNLPWVIFMPFASMGALIWSATFLGLGYGLGETWMNASATVHRGFAVAGGIVFVVLIAILIIRMKKSP